MSTVRDKWPWKNGLAFLCLSYAFVAWVLPVLLTVLFRMLPYMHERSLWERFGISSFGSFGLLLIVALAFPQNYAVYLAKTRWLTIKNGILFSLGLLMLTFTAAWLSPNLFGAIVKITPGSSYQEVFEVVDVSWSNRYVTITLKPVAGVPLHYVSLSKHVVDYPPLKSGDIVRLTGKRNVIGAYVENIRITKDGA